MASVKRRKAHKKVRTGCTACKARRHKCEEQKPICADCVRHSTNCLYENYKLVDRGKEKRQLIAAPKPSMHVTPAPGALNLEDLELLHHFMTSTSIVTSQLPEVTMQVQRHVPQMAQKHQFVMRLILAKAAIHLSWLRPTQRRQYTLVAAKHHGAALPDFRSALQCMTKDNYHAVIQYSKGLVWCAFAGFEAFATIAQGSANSNWLPSWFHLLRGSCKIVDACDVWIEKGLFLKPPPLGDLSDFSNSFESCQIKSLASSLIPTVESSVCKDVLAALYEAFARASMRHQNTPLRNALNFWIGSLSDEYVAMLKEKVPWALVVMAHFCVLVHRSETRWFMRGRAAECMHLIIVSLPDAWTGRVQWPCEEVKSSRSTDSLLEPNPTKIG